MSDQLSLFNLPPCPMCGQPPKLRNGKVEGTGKNCQCSRQSWICTDDRDAEEYWAGMIEYWKEREEEE